ncbi:hypothetical protein GCM10020221_21190 [Streptomyces thioluteus]|uniref:Uncharacterized protein n=1 Tax=Streptomyces thioluteus TaxID=66431 RepID=A0ABN3WUF3_STRTU
MANEEKGRGEKKGMRWDREMIGSRFLNCSISYVDHLPPFLHLYGGGLVVLSFRSWGGGDGVEGLTDLTVRYYLCLGARGGKGELSALELVHGVSWADVAALWGLGVQVYPVQLLKCRTGSMI